MAAATTAARYDDTYAGPRWTYGLTYRPLCSASVPDGWIVFSNRPHSDYPHGTIQYPHPLTAHQCAAYELVLVRRPPAIAHHAGRSSCCGVGLRDADDGYGGIAYHCRQCGRRQRG